MRPSMASADASANDGTSRRGVFSEGAPQTAVAPLRPRLRKDARPRSWVRCVLALWSVVRLVHLTLPPALVAVFGPR